jgi:hypothetical protein
MRFPAAWYQIEQELTARLPPLRPAQVRGLATWVYGTLSGGSASQSAVILEWLAEGYGEAAVRQRLREFLWDGADKAAPCTTAVDVSACFAPLLRWVLDWWTDERLALAIDATNLRDELAVLVVSVLYRGTAIPVAWHVCATTPKAAGQAKVSWTQAILALLAHLRPAIPAALAVLVVIDRGLRSPRLREQLRTFGWHPLMRLDGGTWVRPAGGHAFVPARSLVPAAGEAWLGMATVYKQARTQVEGTLVVVWDHSQQDVWVLLTDLPPAQAGVVWYGLRMWIECGFRVLQSFGWQWQRSRRTHPARVARHWLVLAVTTLWAAAVGTRSEDAATLSQPPATLAGPPATVRLAAHPRRFSIIARGRPWLRRLLHRDAFWGHLWLTPEPWPDPHPRLHLITHPLPAQAIPP